MQPIYEVHAFHLQKCGNDPREYEDAYGYIARTTLRVSIADGATESSFARAWARLLVNSYGLRPFLTADVLKKRLRRLADRWQREIDAARPTLPWFAEEKARMGAFAAFLGLRISTQGTQWDAIAIGDCCLFHIHDGALSAAFPIEESASFGNSPALLSSNLSRNAAVWDKVLLRRGYCSPGDVFILLTDALAAWFLRRCEAEDRPWESLQALRANSAEIGFAGWIESQRSSGQMKNDDVTCLIVEIHSAEDDTPHPGRSPAVYLET